jgi:hypothetical protein
LNLQIFWDLQNFTDTVSVCACAAQSAANSTIHLTSKLFGIIDIYWQWYSRA